ncbi:MAG: hypothetical protein R3A45_00045 [Bdellovibrionota bacterium]
MLYRMLFLFVAVIFSTVSTQAQTCRIDTIDVIETFSYTPVDLHQIEQNDFLSCIHGLNEPVIFQNGQFISGNQLYPSYAGPVKHDGDYLWQRYLDASDYNYDKTQKSTRRFYYMKRHHTDVIGHKMHPDLKSTFTLTLRAFMPIRDYDHKKEQWDENLFSHRAPIDAISVLASRTDNLDGYTFPKDTYFQQYLHCSFTDSSRYICQNNQAQDFFKRNMRLDQIATQKMEGRIWQSGVYGPSHAMKDILGCATNAEILDNEWPSNQRNLLGAVYYDPPLPFAALMNNVDHPEFELVVYFNGGDSSGSLTRKKNTEEKIKKNPNYLPKHWYGSDMDDYIGAVVIPANTLKTMKQNAFAKHTQPSGTSEQSERLIFPMINFQDQLDMIAIFEVVYTP